MRYKLLGRSGLRVSELCLGAMLFGSERCSPEESRKIFAAFVEAGGNFIDTADFYSAGTSEKIVGELVRARRQEIVLATKYTLSSRRSDPNAGGNHRKNLLQSLEASLERLGTDYIDLYWVHSWDPMTPVEEVLRALDDVVRAGKVLYIGVSNTPAWAVSQANTLADLRGWSRFTGLQIPYSLIQRVPERELLPMARALDVAVTSWAPLGAGALSGRYEKDKPYPADGRLSGGTRGPSALTDRNLAIAQVVKAVAAELGHTPSQVAIAWVLAQRKRANIIPIVGTRRVEQIEDNVRALAVTLPEMALARLEEASKIELGYPHEFLARGREVLYGDTFPRIDDHRA